MDPGLATTGYGALEYERPSQSPAALSWGTVETASSTDFPIRLRQLHEATLELVEKFSPDIAAVEKLYFSKNVKTAIKVGQARGVIMLAVACSNIRVVEYSPLKIKKTITGSGKADKKAMQKMLKDELGLGKPPQPADSADALAVAYCHQVIDRFESKIPEN